ncbi:MAG: GNAT family N-acetyltransferase [Tenuifilaceae bacterium]|nr:GNAT family N-acetyltransferase [Tenuifilaceae bacterium]
MDNSITIRKILPADNPNLASMIREVFEEHDAPRIGTVYSDPTTDNLYQLFQQQRSILWVLSVNKQPLGCCGIYPTPGLESDCAELVKFYISSKARGQGFGQLLMEKTIESAREFGFKKIYLESMPQFAKAVSIYKKQGFTYLSHSLGNSGHSGCTIWMIKSL